MTAVNKNREAGFELLRIIAMLMIIALHYLGKGEALSNLGSENFGYNNAIAWIIEAFCFSATNIYVLISGYFLVESSFKVSKIIKIWIQVMFYSLGIFIIANILGISYVPNADGIYNYIYFIFPLSSKHYWFSSVYVAFYLLSPFLAKAAKALSEKQLKTLIIIMFVLYSTIFQTIFLNMSNWTDLGMGIIWFTLLFFVAAYIRLYGIKSCNAIVWLLIYALASVLTFLSYAFIYAVYTKTGMLCNLQKIFYNYNSPTVFAASIAIFIAFTRLKLKDGLLSKIVLFISPLTFGVYLIHENITLRQLWKTLWKVPEYVSKPVFVLHFCAVVIAVFAICCAIDYLRKLVFDRIYGMKAVKKIFEKIDRLNEYFR